MITRSAVIGQHAGCGGDVYYVSMPSAGWRVCDKCKKSTYRRESVELVQDQPPQQQSEK